MGKDEQDVRDLLSWGRKPEDIAEILEMRLSKVTQIIKALKSGRKMGPVAKQPQNVTSAIRKLDAEIQFHEFRAKDLRRYRAELSRVQQTQAALMQEVNR